MRTLLLARPALLVGALLLVTGCLPYTVGSTARTVPTGGQLRLASSYIVPAAVDIAGATGRPAPLIGFDNEVRFGLDDGIDVGVRITSGSGAVVTVKRQLRGVRDSLTTAVALLLGAGIVNFGSHAHFEGSLLVSAPERTHLTPYGGLRVMQVAPLDSYAVSDSPTAGGFLGLRLGGTRAGVSPEIAIYHDVSALELRRSHILIVPSITVHGLRRNRGVPWRRR